MSHCDVEATKKTKNVSTQKQETLSYNVFIKYRQILVCLYHNYTIGIINIHSEFLAMTSEKLIASNKNKRQGEDS